ncbi:pleckstrin homology domain-containing family G member 1 isoform X3 [Clupea harengus]|uniref:Pleckstrin homology domain-containing family G member 1 isoform X3 n=1 Tax=Clupea harengus TaxID=7950 RepID=A0A6P8GR61_CLUHA|nr:pleckstrin homology domain-containing family G member 1 isoform X3 [Clupea harengus]
MPTEDYSFSSDALSPLAENAGGGAVLTSSSPIRNSLVCSSTPNSHSMMDSSHSHHGDRPVSYSSTSSSASSRDSHCSLGGRSILGPAPERDRDAGAIRLELVPARQLAGADEEEGEKGERRAPPAQTRRTDADADGARTPEGEGGPKVAYVDRVVQEILDTERTYVQDLRSIAQDYLDCINNDPRLLLGVEERTALFGNIQEIYRFNSALLHDLEKCNADPVAIAECFVAKSEEFRIYTQYCTNYPRSVAVLTDCMRNKTVAKFLRERQESLKHCLPLGSYLLKPVQRILKYHLLLHEIANHLPKDTEMYEAVLEAIDTMQRVAWHINDMKRKHEHAVRLQEIQSLLTNWKGPDLVGYGELVLEGTFRIQRAKNERTLFLFDKLLLITKKREETYTYKAHILCGNLMLVEVIPKEPLSFSVFHYKNPKLQHTVQAKSQQDKRLWILHLKRLILENHPAKIPAKAKQAILEMDAAHHPGFHYSPDGENKSSVHPKEGPSPRRVRRKSEPLSKLLKNSKQAVASPDVQKRSSLGATLLTPVMSLGSIGRSRSLVSQSHDSLDPTDHGDLSDREDVEGPHQQDADDEDDSGMGLGKRLKVPGKSSRKRLNPQVSVDCIDRLREHNHSDLQTAKESLQMDPSHSPVLQVTSPTESPAEAHVTMPNIWADHRVRRAMFPTRQQTMQVDDDEDIYQMFVPPETSAEQESDRDSTESSSGRPGRPCSWHVEQTTAPATLHLDLPARGGRSVLRRASSVGEQQSEANMKPHNHGVVKEDLHHHNSHGESSSNEISGSSSAEQLTIDDIENVYDNISFEELQAMGLMRRESDVGGGNRPGPMGVSQVKGGSNPPVVEPSGSLPSESKRSSTQEGALVDTCELKIVEEEEGIYDTITFIVPPLPSRCQKPEAEVDSMAGHDSTILSSIMDFSVDESFGMGVSASEESLLRLEDDDRSYVRTSSPAAVKETSPRSSTANSERSRQQKQQQQQRRPSAASDQMSEQVDAIWNDLENYIRDNERKADKLPAAFPVSAHDSAAKCRSATSSPQKKPLSAKTNPSSSPLTRSMSPPSSFKIPSLKIPELRREYSFEVDEPPSLTPTPSPSPAPTPSEPTSHPAKATSKPPPLKSCTSQPLPKGSEPSQPLPPKQKSTQPPAQAQPLPPKPVQTQPLPPKPTLKQASAPTQVPPTTIAQTHQVAPTTTALMHPLPPTPTQVQTHPTTTTTPQPHPPLPTPSPSEPLPPASIPFINVTPVIPEPPPAGTVKSIRNKLARLSSGSFRVDDEDELGDLSAPMAGAPPSSIQKDFHSLFPGLEGSLFPPDLLHEEASDQLGDLDKNKNRVFLMARQYSQKIKKANQLLKMKSMDHEPSCVRSSSSSRSKPKDLAAILEEKKQGGAAIGARIAEYSTLYDQVMFKEAPAALGSQRHGPGGRLSVPHGPRLASSPSLPESATLEGAWLSCTYSNGELAEFLSWTREVPEQPHTSTPQKKLAPASSVPALKDLPPSPSSPPNQRWSTCVTTPTKDDPEHIYSTVGLSSAHSPKDPPYTRCQSSSSLAEQPKKENSGGIANHKEDGSREGQAGIANVATNGRGLGPRQHSLPECPPSHGDPAASVLTLRDSQQVLVLNRVQPLGTLTATQNYLANFHDNGDDDDDYVEIRSEDESEVDRGRTQQTRSLPCSPVKSGHGTAAEMSRDHLKDYLWNEPESHEQSLAQQNIVQSLREKFQCLSSSSFA